jgi:hypothetical protein
MPSPADRDDGPTPEEIERQKEWEMRGVRDGVERYRRRMRDREVADTDHGRATAMTAMRDLAPAVAAAQDDAFKAATSPTPGRRAPPWAAPIMTLPADVLAFITVRALFNAAPTDLGGVPLVNLALAVGKTCRLELEFEQWREDSKERHKEDREVPDVAADILRRSKGPPSPKAFARWKRKLGDIRKVEWPKDLRLALGAKLLKLACEHGAGFFEAKLVKGGQGQQWRVFKTEAAQDALRNRAETAELSQPVIRPMICRPLPWRIVRD